MQKNKKIKPAKTSRGYRLKISTHKLIDKMQIMLDANQDTVITKACIELYNHLINEKNYIKKVRN